MNAGLNDSHLLKQAFMFHKTMGNIAESSLTTHQSMLLLMMLVHLTSADEGLSFDYMEQALAKRGMTAIAPEDVMATFMRMKARVRGRMATGLLLTTTFGTMAIGDRLEVMSHYDRNVQKSTW